MPRVRYLLPLLLLAALTLPTRAVAPIPHAPPPISPRTTLNFDTDWRFFKGEPPAQPTPQPSPYGGIQPTSAAFNDASWQPVTLPHDWSIDGPFDQSAPTTGSGAFLPSGVAWYRKSFALAPDQKGKRVFLQFDGVMDNAEVYLNQSLLGRHPNGYTPFTCDITNLIDWANGGANLLAVRTDTSRQPASRWYTGAGIYRHTRLIITNPVHLENNATFITTPKIEAKSALIQIRTRVTNSSDQPAQFTVMATIYGPPNSAPDGSSAFTAESPQHVLAPGASIEFTFDAPMPWAPRLWSLERPDLHQALLRVRSNNQTLDEETLSFGIRTAEFRPDTGFWLNGKNLKLKGVALHHDAGALGAAVPASAWSSRLAALKKLGVNAIRTAHNPPSPEFLDACDRLGLLVMDELFDAWSVAKEPADQHLFFQDTWRSDLQAIFQRDRNHPSIIIWSLGNEIWDILPQNPDPAPDQFTGPPRTIDLARSIFLPMRDLAHQLDPTRPVTLACMRPNVAHIYDNGFADLEDVIGQNYRDSELAAAHTAKPARKIIGTENYHTRDAWLALRDNPALSGQFLWTGVDYLGESRAWPIVGSSSGLLDRTNRPKNNAFERASWWSEQPVVYACRIASPAGPGRGRGPATTSAPTAPAPAGRGLVTSLHDWTPQNQSPHPETVNVYSNCDSVELFLNDKSLGSKPLNPDASPRTWQVPFEPGTLKAIGRMSPAIPPGAPGAPPPPILKPVDIISDELHTASTPAKIQLDPESTILPIDPDTVLYIRANILDANDTLNPLATHKIHFTLTGPAQLVATDNADPRSHEPFHSPDRTAYQGTCIAILRPTAPGSITLTATTEGLPPATITITATP